VDDLIEAMTRMMETEKGFTGPVNIGNPGEYSMIQLAETILGMIGGKSKIVFRPLPGDDPKQRRPNIELAKEKLGWTPRTSLQEGLEPTIDYFKRTLNA
jgi:UDP-glucuronate decarboxylase